MLLIALIPMALAFYGGTPILQSKPALFALVFLLQYILITPHELGHALVARAFGFSEIRILIGAGKPLFYFHLLGFAWLINRVPFGGLTYAKPNRATLTRTKWILFITGGLIVNGVFLLLAWFLLPRGIFTDGEPTPPNAALLEVFFWSNLIVIVENLAPYTVQTGFGPLSTDGKLLYDAIFFWNKPLRQKEDRIPAWAVWTARVVKVLIVAFLGVCTLALAALAYGFIFAKGLGVGVFPRVTFGAFFLVLTAIFGYSTWRIYSQPVATKRKGESLPHADGWFGEILKTHPSAASPGLVAMIQHQIGAGDYAQALSECERLLAAYPDDLVLLVLQASALAGVNDYARAEAAWDRMLAQITPEEPAVYAEACAQKLSVIMLQNDIKHFAAAAETFLSLPIIDSLKVSKLDQLASNALYLDLRDFIPSAEFCIRKALDLAPGNLTLQGTLGALLLERGKFDKAESLLRACYDRSPAHHDQGISGVYLALIAEHRGDVKTAKTLARQSIILYSEPWLKKKADALFARLGSRNSRGGH